jgi:hypothetical protein
MKGLSAEAIRGIRSHVDQTVDIGQPVSITGRDAEEHLAQVVFVTKGKADDRGKRIRTALALWLNANNAVAKGRSAARLSLLQLR